MCIPSKLNEIVQLQNYMNGNSLFLIKNFANEKYLLNGKASIYDVYLLCNVIYKMIALLRILTRDHILSDCGFVVNLLSSSLNSKSVFIGI